MIQLKSIVTNQRDYISVLRNGVYNMEKTKKQEMDELWLEIRKRLQDPKQIEGECLQVATMACRFLHDLSVNRYPWK